LFVHILLLFTFCCQAGDAVQVREAIEQHSARGENTQTDNSATREKDLFSKVQQLLRSRQNKGWLIDWKDKELD
jgi:hypothetical protein